MKGGALIIIGEDYGEGSSIMQERSHPFAMKSQVWLLDPRPNLPTIVKMVEEGFELSEASNTPVMLEVRIRACHVHGRFVCKDNKKPSFSFRDNGGGTVIGSELVPAKVETARNNLAEAGLAEYAEIRVGDARQTLRDLGGPVDFVLIDGWPLSEGPSLARQVIEIVVPQIRVGGYIMNDNAEPDFLDFVRNPSSGFLSVTLPLKGGTELCVKVA